MKVAKKVFKNRKKEAKFWEEHFDEAWKKGKLFYHINGSYHSDNFESIIWHLKHYKKNLKILTISTIEKKGDLVPDSSEVKLADYIISIPENMSKSY